MDARTPSIKTIFGQDRRHDVPMYQRPYVWNRQDQWEPLWRDISHLADTILKGNEPRGHFLGAIVLEQLRYPYGEVEKRQVIDGQQRLTTLQLVLEAFADSCQRREVNTFHGGLLKLTRNSDPTSDDPDEVFKVWPTNFDRDVFKFVMECGSSQEVRAKYGVKDDQDTESPIADAYLYFAKAIDAWLDGEGYGVEERVKALFIALRDHVRLVVIDLDHGDDPQLIFESLNARGTPLLPADLIKNYLFHRAVPDGRGAEKVYAETWEPFDRDGRYWRRRIGRGHARRPRIDLFLQYFLTMRTGTESDVSRLYMSFRDYVSGGGRTAPDVLGELRRYGDVFRSFDHFPEDSTEADFFERLAAMDITTAHPLLLDLFARLDDPKTLQEVLADLESFLLRRMVCQLSARGYNRHFIELTASLKETPADEVPERLRRALMKSDADATRWPSDDEFEEAWLSLPAYRALRRTRVRMILEALEARLRTNKAEDAAVPRKQTVEHLLPREWRRHWPLPGIEDEVVEEKARERCVHTFGNLTLVSRKLNPSISNGPWMKKRKALQEHTVLRLNIDLLPSDEWREEEIVKRSRRLLGLAKQIWSRPKG